MPRKRWRAVTNADEAEHQQNASPQSAGGAFANYILNLHVLGPFPPSAGWFEPTKSTRSQEPARLFNQVCLEAHHFLILVGQCQLEHVASWCNSIRLIPEHTIRAHVGCEIGVMTILTDPHDGVLADEVL